MPNGPNSNQQHGSATQSCPLAKGAIHVTVLASGTQREVDGVDVTLVQKGASQASDAKGLASITTRFAAGMTTTKLPMPTFFKRI